MAPRDNARAGDLLLSLLFLIGLPLLLAFLFEPVVKYTDRNSTRHHVVGLNYYADGRLCVHDCVVRGRAEKVDVSVVIPAFNEEKRLPVMLASAIPFLQEWSEREKTAFEVVVADDHSTDGTAKYVQELSKTNPKIRLLTLSENCGKGGAVRRGVQYARGQYILMADADGATEMADFEKLWESLRSIEKSIDLGDGDSRKDESRLGIALGSRAHLEQHSVATRSWIRTVLMRGFHVLVMLLATRKIRDTQCGFKLFTRKTARLLFSNLHLEGWSFDIEIIYLAESLGIPLSETSVRWHEVEGSKLIQSKFDVVLTSLKMARDMVCLRLAYLFGIWKFNRKIS